MIRGINGLGKGNVGILYGRGLVSRYGIGAARFPEHSTPTLTHFRHFHLSRPYSDKRAELGLKILNKVPRFLKPYTVNFIRLPIKNLTSFLILHEITAIGPLIGLWYLFHKYDILIPLDLPSWAIEKGTRIIDDSMRSFDFKDYSLHDKFRLISQGAYAFVVVKMLMPVRLVISFGLTPVFTKYIVDPITGLFRKKKGNDHQTLDPTASPGFDPSNVEIKTKKVEKRRL